MAVGLSLKINPSKLPQIEMIFHLRLRYHLCIALLIFACVSEELRAQAPQGPPTPNQIKIPWGFQWGETQSHVEQSLKETKTTIVARKKIGDRDVLAVSGFVPHLLQQALFYFQSDSLNEIELQYGNKDWTSTQYRDFFDQTRSNIESKYGPGRVITQQKTRENQEVLETIIGYQWTQISATLQLFLFTAETANQAFRVVSLHYRGF